MLWLPKWLHDEQAPASEEGVSRRTFLYLAGASVAAVVLPTPAQTAEIVYNVHVGRNVNVCLTQRKLMARVFITDEVLKDSYGLYSEQAMRREIESAARASAERIFNALASPLAQ